MYNKIAKDKLISCEIKKEILKNKLVEKLYIMLFLSKVGYNHFVLL